MSSVSLIERLTPEQIARIRLCYEAGVVPIHEFARDEGLSPRDVQKLRLHFGWPARRTRRSTTAREKTPPKNKKQKKSSVKKLARAKPPAAVSLAPRAAQGNAKVGGLDMDAIVQQVTGLVEREIAEAKAQAGVGETGARTLASLSRALQTLQQIAAGKAAAARSKTGTEETNDEPPLDLAELRRELARKLAALREDRQDG